MSLTTGAGHTFQVSAAAPASFDQTGWEAVAGWEDTPCAESLPELVKRFATVSFNCLTNGATETARGIAEPISFSPPIKDEVTNAGQILIAAAHAATNGTPTELISCKVANAAGDQVIYFQARVFAYGTSERVSTTVFLRVVEMMADANTLVEVNS